MSTDERITNETLAYHSVLWFACDGAGNIILADSCEGDVPAFVKDSLERTEFLARALCGVSAVAHTRVPPLDWRKLADAGFYCFRGDDYDGSVYHLCAAPAKPICLDELDEAVKQILGKQKLPINANECRQFTVAP